MNLSAPFVRRPVATVLLTLWLALAGIGAFFMLPVAPLPRVDFPAISVSASIPGASPDTMASSVATPLERRLGTIAGVNEITSNSSTGSTRISLQFDLERNIDAAAREVQAAINATRADLPATLRSNPTYRKANPAAAPVLILALTSPSRTPGQIYDVVTNVVQQKVSQVNGVGDVEVGGGAQPAVRIELQPQSLNQWGISSEDVRAAIQSTAANRPKGVVEEGDQRWQVYTRNSPGGGLLASDYRGQVIAWRNGAPVRLGDVASVTDSVQNINTLGLYNGQPAVVVSITLQPGANVIETVDGVKALLPQLADQLPSDISIHVASDRTTSIRAALREVEITLVIAVLLVVVVVSGFLRSLRATIIPTIATVVSLLGTFAAMWLLGFSLNNLSLMALTVATGFVVDDAIVVLENVTRHMERGLDRFQAALLGAREVGFTVLSISLSLVAVFIPLLFMGGQVGRLFREFAVTLSVAVMISLVLSLTTTPMLCAWLLRPGTDSHRPTTWLGRALEGVFAWTHRTYAACLDWALQARGLVLALLLAVVAINVFLFMKIPKGYFPQQDTAQIFGGIRADRSISFQAMQDKLRILVEIIRADPAVATVVGFTGGSRAGGGFVSVTLKPASERPPGERGQAVIGRLRPQLARVPGVQLFLSPAQDLRMGARQSNSSYEYTLKSDNVADLRVWATRLAEAMRAEPALVDVDTDQQENGIETYAEVDRDTAARLGITARDIDNALYNLFGQRQVATLYNELNQYTVVLGTSQTFASSPLALREVYVPARNLAAASLVPGAISSSSIQTTASATGSSASAASPPATVNPGARDQSGGRPLANAAAVLVPLTSVVTMKERPVAASVSHEDAELATTISYNLAEGRTLADGRAAVRAAEAAIAMPANVRGSFSGTARAAQDSAGQQPLLILAALVVIYIVLGVLYESLVHPVTVLSTLPSAGVGAVMALLLFDMELSIMALIGLFLLIGIVKKNAILIIDFALDAERSRGLSPLEAVREACLLRFRPILMTTIAAALGALPLAIGFGDGAELRRPLGVAIIGGLVASQVITLITTPVVYLLLDKLRRRSANDRALARSHELEAA